MRRMQRWLWVLWTASILSAADAAALDPKQVFSTVTGQPAAADEAAATPLAARDIPARADADEQFADDVLRRARGVEATETLGREVDELARGVATLARRTRGVDLARQPAIRLESLQRNWRFYRHQLADWQGEAQRQLDLSSADAAQLAARRATWAATRTQGEAADVSPALLERVDDVLARIEAADRTLAKPLARQIELGRRGAAVADSIETGVEAIDAALATFDFRLAARDAPPLWTALQEARPAAGGRAAARGEVGLDRDFLSRYFDASRDRLLVHAVFAVLLLPVLVWLRRRSLRLIAGNPELRGSMQALLRPISAWLVLVLVATIFFQYDSPIVLHEAALLIAVIPVLRLLPKEVFAALGWWPYAATALYVLQRLSVLFIAQPLWYRLHLLGVTLLTLGALAWIILQARRRTPAAQARPIQRAARLVGLLGLIALVASVMANLFGNVTLAELLTRGTLDSGYLGLVLFAGASVLGSIVRQLLARRGAPHLPVVAGRARPLLETLARLIRYAAAAAWVLIALNEFRILRPIQAWASRVLNYPFGVGEISLTLGSILLFAVAVYVAFWIARTMRTVLRDEVLGRMSLPRGVANSVSTLTYYALVLVGLLVALAASGFEVGQLAIVVGALGVGIGFGLQNVVNNFVSGLILMFERPIQPGDWVEITGTTGKVREIGMRATTLTTPEGADVVVPNGTLLSEKLVNWTLSDMTRRVDVDVGVAYGSDAKQVLELLKQVALSTNGIIPQPEPLVLLTGLGAGSLNVGIRAWTNDFNDWAAIRSDLTTRIYDALREAGIGIPVSKQDLLIHGEAKGAGIVAPDQAVAGT
jgi:small-conductance mechanosensitive channel